MNNITMTLQVDHLIMEALRELKRWEEEVPVA